MYWINIIPKGRWSKGMEENSKIIIFRHNIYLFPLGPGQYVKITIMLTIWLKLFPISSMPLICWYKYLFLFVPNFNLSSVQSLNYVRLCDPMNHSTPGLPVYHQLPEFTQTHAHWVGDAIQPSHPLSSPSPPAPNPSQHQGLFQWVNSSHEVAKVLEFQLQQF